MSRRPLIPTNVFQRQADPIPPLFPEPTQGDLYFNTSTKALRIFDNGKWRDVGGGGGGGVSDHGELTGLEDVVGDDHPHYLNTARGDARYIREELEVAISDIQPSDLETELWIDTAAPGPAPPGEFKEDMHYVHVQSTLSKTWSIGHGLGKHPAVTITDAAGTQIYGTIRHLSATLLEITFNSTTTGTAYCN